MNEGPRLYHCALMAFALIFAAPAYDALRASFETGSLGDVLAYVGAVPVER